MIEIHSRALGVAVVSIVGRRPTGPKSRRPHSPSRKSSVGRRTTNTSLRNATRTHVQPLETPFAPTATVRLRAELGRARGVRPEHLQSAVAASRLKLVLSGPR